MDDKTDVDIGTQQLNDRATPALAYPLSKVTATVTNYQSLFEIVTGELLKINDIALHPEQWQLMLYSHLQAWFENEPVAQLEIWNALACSEANLEVEQSRAGKVDTEPPILAIRGTSAIDITNRQCAIVSAGDRTDNHEAGSAHAQIAQGLPSDVRPHYRVSTGQSPQRSTFVSPA
jgi:hypothetical protein